ncbi:uncharacterized protein LOC135480501 [Liolophura sinensis]|uniref:uncharacterized protein LOC135480501 n=1 Tax=Liolophura sinensis TaxID=3198878 RepID=UPI0031595DEA
MVRSLTLLALLALTVAFGRETELVSRVSFTGFGQLVLEILNPNGTVKECEVYADSDTIQEILSEVPEESKFLVSTAELRAKISGCINLNTHTVGTQSNWRRKRSVLKGIYPGTLWCGKGNMAMGDSEAVGSLVEEDTCCGITTSAFLKYRAGETKYGLTNDGSYTGVSIVCIIWSGARA